MTDDPRDLSYRPKLSDDQLDAEVLQAALALMERGLYPGIEPIAKRGGVARDRHRIGRSLRRLEASGALDRSAGPPPPRQRRRERAPRPDPLAPCPLPEGLLRDYVAGRTRAATGHAVGQHLARCATCRALMPREPTDLEAEVRAAKRRERDRKAWYVICPQWEPDAPRPETPRSVPTCRKLLETTEIVY